MKLVINTCYGGFGISKRACEWLLEHNVKEPFKSSLKASLDKVSYLSSYLGFADFTFRDYEDRTHPLLVECVETLGKEVNTTYSDLTVVDIDSDAYRITDYDGIESVQTPYTVSWIINKYK